MNEHVTTKELKEVIALKDLPDEHLEWIIKHSRYEKFNDGDTAMKTGEPIEEMGFILEGKMSFYMNIKGQLVYYYSFENNNSSGGVTGLLPYSRMKSSPGTSFAVGNLRLIWLHKKYYQELEQLNPEFIQRLIGYMTERARSFATTQLQQEKVSALGKLAAGIAHELNNPAAAIGRISEELNKRLNQNLKLTEDLLKFNITSDFIKNIREKIKEKKKNNSANSKLTPLQRIQNEDDLNDWLTDNGYDDRSEIAETLAEAGFLPEDLESIHKSVDAEAFENILSWFENLLSSELIIKDLDDASNRISELVGAIKSHVHMDRSGDLHNTDIHQDLENTLVLLGYKIRDKNISVVKRYCDNIHNVEAYIGELNQVWTNIIDNAIYAVPQKGEIVIQTDCDEKIVTVRVIDNGSGIPAEIKTRIFDPFFTSKKIGEGTGIGLDIVKNVIKKHDGDIKVNSIPGKTEFVVSLPVTQNLIKEET